MLAGLRVPMFAVMLFHAGIISAASFNDPTPNVATTHGQRPAVKLAEELQTQVQGDVYWNGSTGWQKILDGYLYSGVASDQDLESALILQPKSIDDIITGVHFGQKHGLELAVKGGGHSLRTLYLTHMGLTIDMSNFKEVWVDPKQQEVRFQGGIIYRDILNETLKHGLAMPWGDASITGMGLALGGGIGYLSRVRGLMVDNLINATMVVANGSVVTASSKHNPDLLAAMKGGGTVFGVVVESAYKVYDVSDYSAGLVAAKDDANGTAFRLAHQWAAEATQREPNIAVEILQVAVEPGVIIVQVLVSLNGNSSVLPRDELYKPLRELPGLLEDKLGRLNFYEFMQVVTNAAAPDPKETYVVSAMLTFSQAKNGALEELLSQIRDMPKNVTAIWLADYFGSTGLDNAMKNTTSLTPFAGDVDMHYFVAYSWDKSFGSKFAPYAAAKKRALEPLVISTQPYVNLATVTDSSKLEVQVGGAANLAKLRAQKVAVDPNNVFKRHAFVGLWNDNMQAGT